MGIFDSANKILPKRSTESGCASFKNSYQKAADVLSLTVDGKQKEFDGNSTYANIKTIFKSIQKSAYFEKLNQPQLQQPQCQQSIETPELSELLDFFLSIFYIILIVLTSRSQKMKTFLMKIAWMRKLILNQPLPPLFKKKML